MTLLIETPLGRDSERDYVFGVLFGDFLGLDWRRLPAERDDVRITLTGNPRCEILLPDVLFKIPEAQWLTAESLPAQPLPIWDSSDLELSLPLTESTLPVIYGDACPAARYANDRSLRLPVDLFGSAFFMLTRYEELVKIERDEHDRFPAWASLAYQEGFLELPIVDEYVEVLWATMASLWPQLSRRQRTFQIKVSHDLDCPARYQFLPFHRFLRAFGGDIIKRRDFRALLLAPRVRFSRGDRLHPADPYNTFDWIMNISERNGLRSAFYFICGHTNPERDSAYKPSHPAIRALMRRIHERGHEIGLHPSYNTYRDPLALKREADTLLTICSEEGIHQTQWGGRMHYLRWDQATTPRAWDAAGMAYDSTLGYADRTGFRCGTSHEYPAFDVLERSALNLRLRPLIAMECSVFDKNYMGLDDAEACEHLTRLRDRIALRNGTFTLLWHNSEFVSQRLRRFYSKLIDTDFRQFTNIIRGSK